MKCLGIKFRAMTLDDLSAVLRVEHASFATPWPREAFYNELVYNRLAHYKVVEKDGRVVGYSGMWLVLDEAHVTNIAIHPDLQGQGIGEQALEDLMKSARKSGAHHMMLEVRASNHIAQNLYRKKGFQPIGIRPHYYTDNQEDAVMMQVKLGGEMDEIK
ncbi:ribosomal protein S18-alanine N-acetyltransferase [Melghirimyces algeriensis]|uniref:Ribosomal-protein-alanine N-acetyltransferase n=1 Tax=Melghirimyces algeriensis TaxID=910412 RepID=A0A521FE29_9BACL|nr:ribosomal protein S18-alanine N-acetyltransferase [Melghirimyces algeriensis]SMO94458.1 ribosomal-protein-alanine N-acetyltransferase [Melghirimyces algeriensis]